MKGGVFGAGPMGAETALVFALARHDVLSHDRGDETLASRIDQLRGILDKGVSRQFYEPEAASAALAQMENEAMSEAKGPRARGRGRP